LAVREDDAEPEPLEDESKMLEDGDVVAMAVKVGIIAQQLLMQCAHTIIGSLSDSLLRSLIFSPPGATVVVADIPCWICHTERGRSSGYADF
jgi:hypothetical protein